MNRARLIVLLVLASAAGLNLATEAAAQSGPGGYPYYQYPPAIPGVQGPTEYLMPDGGRWVQYGNVMPGVAPPPVYIPPEYPQEVIIYDHRGSGYGPHDHSHFHRHN